MGALITTIINSNIDTKKNKPYQSYGYKLAKIGDEVTLMYDDPNKGKNSSSGRKPMTDVNEWNRTMEMARVFNGAYVTKQ